MTETDPAGDTITHTFVGQLETQRVLQDVNLGVLSKTVTCYNGHNSNLANCVTMNYELVWPLLQTDVYIYLGTSTHPSLVETIYDTYGNVTR